VSPLSASHPSARGNTGASTEQDLYRLESIVLTDAPDGSDGTWYRYIIVQGGNVITGMRPGMLADLNPVLQDMVLRLNARAEKRRAKERR
jgi:hypothetical protein